MAKSLKAFDAALQLTQTALEGKSFVPNAESANLINEFFETIFNKLNELHQSTYHD